MILLILLLSTYTSSINTSSVYRLLRTLHIFDPYKVSSLVQQPFVIVFGRRSALSLVETRLSLGAKPVAGSNTPWLHHRGDELAYYPTTVATT